MMTLSPKCQQGACATFPKEEARHFFNVGFKLETLCAGKIFQQVTFKNEYK